MLCPGIPVLPAIMPFRFLHHISWPYNQRSAQFHVSPQDHLLLLQAFPEAPDDAEALLMHKNSYNHYAVLSGSLNHLLSCCRMMFHPSTWHNIILFILLFNSNLLHIINMIDIMY